MQFQRRLSRCRTPGRLAQLRSADPDLFQAHELYTTGGWQRTLLEARLLATVPYPEIGRLHDVTEEAVEAYANIFFDIAARLEARDYITGGAIGDLKQDASFADATQRQIKLLGYFHGPVFVELLAKHVFDAHGQLLPNIPDLGTKQGRLETRLRLFVALSEPGISLSYMHGIMRTSKRIYEMDKQKPQPAPSPEQVLADVKASEAILGPAVTAPRRPTGQYARAVATSSRETTEFGQAGEARKSA